MSTVMASIENRAPHSRTRSSNSSGHGKSRAAGRQAQLAEVLSELHSLLEEYWPAWYSEELHHKTELALHYGKKA